MDAQSGPAPSTTSTNNIGSASDIPDRVYTYQPSEIDPHILATRTKEVLDKAPFTWQLEIAAAILCGQDVIVDVGTGNGKTLSFEIPMVLHDTDVSVRVTPITALMIEQVRELTMLKRPRS